MQRTICHRGQTLEYEFTPKRVKNINLRVHEDGSVSVSAPPHTSQQAVENFLRLRWDWIAAVRLKMRSRTQPEFGWREGESFHLLGRAVTVHRLPGEKAAAFLREDRLVLTLPDITDDAKAAAAGEKWFESACREALAPMEERVWNAFRPKGVRRPPISLRWMTSRWGSCNPKRCVIHLSKRLFAMPPRVVEYVLIHEYCHLLEANHQAGFYRLMDEFVPDRKPFDKALKSGAFRFIR